MALPCTHGGASRLRTAAAGGRPQGGLEGVEKVVTTSPTGLATTERDAGAMVLPAIAGVPLRHEERCSLGRRYWLGVLVALVVVAVARLIVLGQVDADEALGGIPNASASSDDVECPKAHFMQVEVSRVPGAPLILLRAVGKEPGCVLS
jgi:hypothetical protein